MKASAVLFIFVCVFFASVTELSALPKFASRVGAKCQACHVNPTGKGMRNTFGSTYGREELPMRTYKTVVDTSEDGKVTVTRDDATNLEDFSTNLTQNFSIGADFRNLYFYDGRNKSTSFFQMQGDLYFDLRLNKTFRVYFDKGLYSGFEVFGLAKVLPLDGYIKVGKFIPAYGMKVDDHNSFIRGGSYSGQFLIPSGYEQGLRFGERSEDTGLEFGIAPGMFSVQAGLFNGTPGAGISGTSGMKTKAFALRADATVQTQEINFNVGASFYNKPAEGTASKLTYYGGFGSLTALKSLTLTSEFDFLVKTVNGKDATGIVYYNELNYMAWTGVDLKLGYEFYDPDKDLKNGAFTRITVGAEFFPMSGVEVRPLYRINKEQPKEISNDEFQVLFHFYL